MAVSCDLMQRRDGCLDAVASASAFAKAIADRRSLGEGGQAEGRRQGRRDADELACGTSLASRTGRECDG